MDDIVQALIEKHMRNLMMHCHDPHPLDSQAQGELADNGVTCHWNMERGTTVLVIPLNTGSYLLSLHQPITDSSNASWPAAIASMMKYLLLR